MAQLVNNAGTTVFDGQILNGGSQTVYVQPEDPGAVGAGTIWVDTSSDPVVLKVRTAANDDWESFIAQNVPWSDDLDGGGNSIRNLNQVFGNGLSGSGAGSGGTGTDVTVVGGQGNDGATNGAAFVAQGGTGVADGAAKVKTGGSFGLAGQSLVSDGNGDVVFGGVRTAPEVPIAAPSGVLPFAVDTTAVSGGFYYWNGAAWVKLANAL